MDICLNIAHLWATAEFEQKRILQNMLFPAGILLNKENKVVRTERVNEIVLHNAGLQRDAGDHKKGKTTFQSFSLV